MLIACKAEINYSKRDFSIFEFSAIEANREVACVDGAGRGAAVQSDERKLDRYDWNLASSHRRRNRMNRAPLLLISEKLPKIFFYEKPSHQ